MHNNIEGYLGFSGRPSIGEVQTPNELAQEMINKLPEEIFISDKTTFLDPCFGTGTFLKAAARRFRKYGHSKENINSRLIGVEKSIRFINKACKEWGDFKPTLIHADFLEYDFKDMKFDVVIGNPPYNGPSKEGTSRQSRNGEQLYKTFIEKCIKLNPKYLSFVIPYVWMLGKNDINVRKNLLMLGIKKIKHNPLKAFEGTNVLTVNVLCEPGYKGPITQQRYNSSYTELLEEYQFTYTDPTKFIPTAYTQEDFELFNTLCSSQNNMNIKSGGTKLTKKQKSQLTKEGDLLWWGGKDQFVRVSPNTPDNSPYNDNWRVSYRYLIGMEPQLSRTQYVFDTQIIEPGVRVREKNRIIICSSREEAENVYANLNSPLINKLIGFMCKSASLDNWIIQNLPDLRTSLY